MPRRGPKLGHNCWLVCRFKKTKATCRATQLNRSLVCLGPKTRSRRDRDEAKAHQGETLRRHKQTDISFCPQRSVVSLGFFDNVSASSGLINVDRLGSTENSPRCRIDGRPAWSGGPIGHRKTTHLLAIRPSTLINIHVNNSRSCPPPHWDTRRKGAWQIESAFSIFRRPHMRGNAADSRVLGVKCAPSALLLPFILLALKGACRSRPDNA